MLILCKPQFWGVNVMLRLFKTMGSFASDTQNQLTLKYK